MDEVSHYWYRRGIIRWSPDSSLLAFAYAREYPVALDTVRLIRFQHGEIVNYEDVAIPALDLQWSPDSKQLLIVHPTARSPLIYDVTTKKKVSLPSPSMGTLDTEVQLAAWSPDGKHIAFVTNRSSDLYVINTDGTGLAKIPPLVSDATSPPFIHYLFWLP